MSSARKNIARDFIAYHGQWIPVIVAVLVTILLTLFLLKQLKETTASKNYTTIVFIDLLVFTGTAYGLGWLWAKFKRLKRQGDE